MLAILYRKSTTFFHHLSLVLVFYGLVLANRAVLSFLRQGRGGSQRQTNTIDYVRLICWRQVEEIYQSAQKAYPSVFS